MPREPKFYLTEMQEHSLKMNLSAAVTKRPFDIPDAMIVSKLLLKELQTYKPGKKLYYAYVLGLRVYVDDQLCGRGIVLISSRRIPEGGHVKKVGGD